MCLGICNKQRSFQIQKRYKHLCLHITINNSYNLNQIDVFRYYRVYFKSTDNTFHFGHNDMARMVCDSSLLKSCNPKFKGLSLASRFFDKCDLSTEESLYRVKDSFFYDAKS